MILEHTGLDVTPGCEEEFEQAFDVAKSIIAAAPGFLSLRLLRCTDNSSRYVLLVEWSQLEDHTGGLPPVGGVSASLHVRFHNLTGGNRDRLQALIESQAA